MLRQRVLTALVLAPLVLWMVLAMPNSYLALVLAGVLLVGGGEWAKLSGVSSSWGRAVFILLLALSMVLAELVFSNPGWIVWLLIGSLFWWLLVLIRLLRFRGDRLLSGVNYLQLFEGMIVLLPAWLALVHIHKIPQDGPYLLVFLLLLIWSADIGAYFSGRRWGRVKLAPVVSPGKTREGVYGAMLGALACGLVLAWWQGEGVLNISLAILLCLLTALLSVVGDLFESMLKRQRDIKDSGSLLPGHGGMLDRIDSLTAAAPLFLLGLIVLGKVA